MSLQLGLCLPVLRFDKAICFFVLVPMVPMVPMVLCLVIDQNYQATITLNNYYHLENFDAVIRRNFD